MVCILANREAISVNINVCAGGGGGGGGGGLGGWGLGFFHYIVEYRKILIKYQIFLLH